MSKLIRPPNHVVVMTCSDDNGEYSWQYVDFYEVINHNDVTGQWTEHTPAVVEQHGVCDARDLDGYIGTYTPIQALNHVIELLNTQIKLNSELENKLFDYEHPEHKQD